MKSVFIVLSALSCFLCSISEAKGNVSKSVNCEVWGGAIGQKDTFDVSSVPVGGSTFQRFWINGTTMSYDVIFYGASIAYPADGLEIAMKDESGAHTETGTSAVGRIDSRYQSLRFGNGRQTVDVRCELK
jgi:hypothetical protein